MIKEKKKKSKYNFNKTKKQILIEYLRTVAISVFCALIITVFLVFRARNEMIKNISTSAETRNNMDKQLAEQLIQSLDLMKDLRNKKYAICMYTGNLYATVEDYQKAQIAYELAVEKARSAVYAPYYKLICVLTAQNKVKEAEDILKNIKDKTEKNLIRFKTRSYIVIGDKYYSNSKFLSAVKNYEKADFYYNKFSKKDKVVSESIKYRIVSSYIEAADILVKRGLNSDATRLLKKAEKYSPSDFDIKYRLAIILSELDPEESIKYIEPLLDIMPQKIDYNVYGNAYLKAATIADLDGRFAQAKYYRYKIHSIDLFINNKVIYKNDIDIDLLTFTTKKKLFTYPLIATYAFTNISNFDITKLYADFVLTYNGEELERVTKKIASKDSPLLIFAEKPNYAEVKFKRKVFTRKELANYTVEIYLYKDKKYKTHVSTISIPN